MTSRKRNAVIYDTISPSESKSKVSKTTKYTKPTVTQNNTKIFNVKHSDYLSYDDLKSMRMKINELATLNHENEEEIMQDFEENYSGIISIITLFCTINKLFEDVGWKFSNYNKL